MDNDVQRAIEGHLSRRFLNCRCQARHRNEPFELTKDQFIDLWMQDERWRRAGRGRNDLVMIRRDTEGPWSTENIEIITRLEMLRREHDRRRKNKGGQ